VAVSLIATSAGPVGAAPPPYAVNLSLSGKNGVGRIVTGGLSCANGGQGNYRHYTIDTPLAPGTFTSLSGQLRGSLDVHHDGVEPPVGPVTTNAFLLGNETHVTFSNQRGTIQLRLSSGTCQSPTLPFDGRAVGPAPGTWVVDPTSASNTGAYRQTSGSGTFTLTAGIGPGADNPWALGLTGNFTILEPSLGVSVVSVFWGSLGLDYVSRIVSVIYQITNTGPGDVFGASLVTTTSPTAGVTPLGPVPQPIGDLAAGQAATVTVRYQLGLLHPCALVILGCQFDTNVQVALPDALDRVTSPSASAHVVAPTFPPPL
jgi:hypothetical protein